jgi:hypothetical protein
MRHRSFLSSSLFEHSQLARRSETPGEVGTSRPFMRPEKKSTQRTHKSAPAQLARQDEAFCTLMQLDQNVLVVKLRFHPKRVSGRFGPES